ncbi:MAG: hypothetical protein ABFS39_19375 [Pseudomonadota bacterium]
MGAPSGAPDLVPGKANPVASATLLIGLNGGGSLTKYEDTIMQNKSPSNIETPRFTQAEYEQIFSRLAEIFAGTEALWQIIAEGPEPRVRGRLIDTARMLAQVGGLIADHAGQDCNGYGDVFDWLSIPRGKQEVQS